MVFDIVIGATRELLGNVCPPVTMVLVERNENCLFVVSPFSLLQLRVEVVDKAFSTLLALSTGQMRSNLCPLSPIKLALLSENVVFLGGPRALSFDDGRT